MVSNAAPRQSRSRFDTAHSLSMSGSCHVLVWDSMLKPLSLIHRSFHWPIFWRVGIVVLVLKRSPRVRRVTNLHRSNPPCRTHDELGNNCVRTSRGCSALKHLAFGALCTPILHLLHLWLFRFLDHKVNNASFAITTFTLLMHCKFSGFWSHMSFG